MDATRSFVLRHARFRISGHWSNDDYDVIHNSQDIGRIFRPGAGAPTDMASAVLFDRQPLARIVRCRTVGRETLA